MAPAQGCVIINEGKPMEQELSREFLRVVEEAAIAAARTMGMGNQELSDRAAVETMRQVLDTIPVNGGNS
jgi:fructose-1,6-bisphosphatase/sedoheptulose 1,7-bisphosphatase-like protein